VFKLKTKMKIISTICLIILLGIGYSLTYANNKSEKVLEKNSIVKLNNSNNKSNSNLEKVQELNKKVVSGEEKLIAQDARFISYTEDQLLNESDLILYGQVKKKIRDYFINTDIPFSDYELQVKDIIIINNKFELDENMKKTLIVTQDGNTQFEFEGHPLLQPQQDYVLFLKFLKEDGNEKLLIVGGPMGKLDIKDNKLNQKFNTHNQNGKNTSSYLNELKVKISK
jgi:hypothetical protein